MKNLIILFSALIICGLCAENSIIATLCTILCAVGLYETIRMYGAKRIYRDGMRIINKILD